MKRSRLKLLGVVVFCGAAIGVMAVKGMARAVDWDQKDPVSGVLGNIKKENPGKIPEVKGAPVKDVSPKALVRNGPDIVHVSVYCASRNFNRASCSSGLLYIISADAQQVSKAACIEGQTWGSSRSSIWVDRGCRAWFDVWGVAL